MQLVDDPKPAASVPWKEMFRSGSLRRGSGSSTPRTPTLEDPAGEAGGLDLDPHARLALYIAMAHAGLALGLLLLYGLYRLLHEFARPLQWALLCSIPLREARLAIVSFWSAPLRAGLLPAFLAPLAALLRASAHTFADARSLLLRRPRSPSPSTSFSRLLRWLVSFWALTISHDSLGPLPTAAIFLAGLFLAAPTAAAVRKASFAHGVGSCVTSRILASLQTIVTVGLILGMILGFLSGGIFFSYKITVESKDAVVALKSHVQSSNYALLGFRQWMNDNDVPGMVERYSAALYHTLWQQIDTLAAQYNMTELANGFKHFLIIQPITAGGGGQSTTIVSPPHPYTIKFHSLSSCLRNRNWTGVYSEIDSIFSELLITREDLMDRAKGIAFQGLDIAKQVFASGTTVLGRSTSMVLFIGVAVVSGAAEIMNFISQLMVFLWVLYYLITLESGGATEQVVGLLPVSRAMRLRFVEVINKAISSVLLATAKVAVFQGCLTWLLLRSCSVHFLYMSTLVAVICAMMPLLPTWLSSVPASIQFFMEGRYIWAIGVPLIHIISMDYGTSVILEDIPGHNAYLTGLSIIGGMTLFHNAIEGAIMGPLILTLFIALKNLYAEFVLVDTHEKSD